MTRHAANLGLLFAVVAAIASFAAWALYRDTGGGWADVVPVLPYLLAGVLTVGAVIVVFIWLAGFSERRGYDRRAGSSDEQR